MGDKGPRRVFSDAAPRLGARVENQMTIGHKFTVRGGPLSWTKPGGAPPLGSP